jgi:hypothetical protein
MRNKTHGKTVRKITEIENVYFQMGKPCRQFAHQVRRHSGIKCAVHKNPSQVLAVYLERQGVFV